jgi:hypothetical protein
MTMLKATARQLRPKIVGVVNVEARGGRKHEVASTMQSAPKPNLGFKK